MPRSADRAGHASLFPQRFLETQSHDPRLSAQKGPVQPVILPALLFRGFLFKAMLKDGNVKTAIIISSVTFGMGHIVNLLTGHALFETLVQMAFAVAIGFIFTMVYYKCGSLLPLILAHSAIDVLSVFAVDNAVADGLFIGTTIVTAVLYCWYLSRLETPEVNR